jgi:hypothetical protein
MPKTLTAEELRKRMARYEDSNVLLMKPKEIVHPEPVKSDPETHSLLKTLSGQLAVLTETTSSGLAGVMESLHKPEPEQQPEAWEFEIIRDKDNRIKKIKATRK